VAVPKSRHSSGAKHLLQVPIDPDFKQLAPVIAYGKFALGFNQICPRDGHEHCSLVDALHKEGNSAKANQFQSWVWTYTCSTVLDAQRRWREETQCKTPTYVWWCFFCNNQYRMLQDGQTASTEELADTFGANLKRIGKMWILLDSLTQAKYVGRIWCIFEVFVARSYDIPCSIILPEGEAHLNSKLVTIQQLKEACVVHAEGATAGKKADEDGIKKLIIDEFGSFAAVNAVVEEQLRLVMMHILDNAAKKGTELGAANKDSVDEDSAANKANVNVDDSVGLQLSKPAAVEKRMSL